MVRRAIGASFLSIAICALAAVFTSPSPACALMSAPPQSYSRTLPSGLELVMIVWRVEYDRGSTHAMWLRHQYSSSGLYRADGSVVWALDWYSSEIEITPDGEFMVRFDQKFTPRQPSETEAIRFYRNGRLLRAYRIDELIDRPDRMPRRMSPWWLRRNVLHPTEERLDVETLTGERFTFDVRTGEIVSEYRPVQWFRRMLRRGLVFGILMAFVLIARLKSNRRIATIWQSS